MLNRTNLPYTPAGRLCSKLQDYTGTGNICAYSPNSKQHAVRRIYNGLTNELYNLLWDANGNLAQQTVYSVNNNTTNYQTMRMLFWDEDDRLNLVAGDGYLSYYAYGNDGNRAIKMTGNAAIDQTGTLLNSTNLENITIYPNEYLTVTQAEYTKYYYAGGNRIASKIGTGGFGKMTRLCTLDQSLSYNANVLFDNVIQQIVSPINQPNDEFPVDVCSGYSVSTELLINPLPNIYISNTSLNFTQNNLLQQFRQNLAGGTEAVYYFHSDHLGSASWITNNTGLPVQHLQYLPFGEHFANERSTAYDERFTFTGKERDAETGYYYHGARFNCSDIGWLSVDPLADKYPSLSPYNYCAWNPVKLVDPDGREMGDFYSKDGTYLNTDGNNDGKVYIVKDQGWGDKINNDRQSGKNATLDLDKVERFKDENDNDLFLTEDIIKKISSAETLSSDGNEHGYFYRKNNETPERELESFPDHLTFNKYPDLWLSMHTHPQEQDATMSDQDRADLGQIPINIVIGNNKPFDSGNVRTNNFPTFRVVYFYRQKKFAFSMNMTAVNKMVKRINNKNK